MNDIVQERLSKNIHPTTEGMFGFIKQPEEQCPLVNKILDEHKKILNEASKIDAEVSKIGKVTEIEELQDIERSLDWIRYNIENMTDLEHYAEELRSNIENLRAWGQQWKNFAKELINKNNLDIEDYIHGI